MDKFNLILSKYMPETSEAEVDFYHQLVMEYAEECPGDYVLVLPCLVLPVSSIDD